MYRENLTAKNYNFESFKINEPCKFTKDADLT